MIGQHIRTLNKLPAMANFVSKTVQRKNVAVAVFQMDQTRFYASKPPKVSIFNLNILFFLISLFN